MTTTTMANSRSAALSCMMALNNRGVDLFTTGQDVQGAIECFRGALHTIERHLFTSMSLKKENHQHTPENRSQHEKEPNNSPIKTEREVIIKSGNNSTIGLATSAEEQNKSETRKTDNVSLLHRCDPRSHMATSLSSRLQETTLHISTRLVKIAPSASVSKGDGREELHRACLAALTTSFNLALTYQMMSYLSPVEKSTKLRHSALGFYEMAISIRQRIGDRCGDGVRRFLTVLETSMLNNIAVLYHELGDNARCRCYFKRLHSKLPQFQQFGDPRQTKAASMSFLGNLVLMLGPKGGWECSPAAAA